MDEGFLAPRRTSPTTLGVVILAHVAVLTAVIVAKGPPITLPPEITRIIDIPPETIPDPVPPPPTRADPKPQTRPRDAVDVQPPLVPTDAGERVAVVDLPPTPPLPPLPPIGPIVEPLPPRAPQLTEAAPDPRFARDLQPPYPPSLMRAEVEGRATVRVLVGADGRVKAVEIVSADDPAFAEATRKQALAHWRFRPATRDGVAVEAWRTMTVRFRLDA